MDDNFNPQDLSGRFGTITFRAHESEPQVFEDFLTIFLPILRTTNYYAYSVELDQTPQRHIHCIFSLTSKQIDKSKIEQKFLNKQMKDFKKSLEQKQTQFNHAWFCKLVGNSYHDVMKMLGYTMKGWKMNETQLLRYELMRINLEVVTQAVEYYESTARIKKSCVNNDWKQINAKNFHILCEAFAEQNDMTVHDYELIAKMTHARHTFNIPDKMLKKHLAELKFANKDYDVESPEYLELNKFQGNYCDPSTEEEYKNEIKQLKKEKNEEYMNACEFQQKLQDARNQITRLKREVKRLQQPSPPRKRKVPLAQHNLFDID